MFSLTKLVCKIFLIPDGVTGDSDVLLILCISVVTIWGGSKIWGGLFGRAKEEKVSSALGSFSLASARDGEHTSPSGNRMRLRLMPRSRRKLR